jgi:hypothetical protein
MFRNYIGYVFRYEYPVPKQHVVPPTYTPHLVGNQFPKMVHPITNKDREHVQ